VVQVDFNNFSRISLVFLYEIMRRKIKKEKEKDEIAKKIVAIGKHFIRIQNSVIAKCFEISALKYGCLLVISTRSSCGHRVFLLPVFPPILSCSESYSSGVIKAKRQSAGPLLPSKGRRSSIPFVHPLEKPITKKEARYRARVKLIQCTC